MTGTKHIQAEAGRRAIIEVRDLSYGYGEDAILEGVRFDVLEGEIFVVLGESGCGKTTLMKVMVGLLPPSGGSVVVDGRDLSKAPEEEVRLTLMDLGILFQGSALIGSMTLAENVALPLLEFSGLPENVVANLVDWKLSLVGLKGFEGHLPSEVSGGMRKRAGLARALALNPKIIFLDEPSAGLDPVTAAEIDDLILKINAELGTTLVIVTHELASIYSLAHRVIMLDRERRGIIAEGVPAVLRDTSTIPSVRRFFNREARTESGPPETRAPETGENVSKSIERRQ